MGALNFVGLTLTAACLLAACGGGGDTQQIPLVAQASGDATAASPDTGVPAAQLLSETVEEMLDGERDAPIDFGGLAPSAATGGPARSVLAATIATSTVPVVPAGGPTAHVSGVFGAPFAWPIIPVHMVLLSDGRVLAYGTDTRGRQSGLLNYVVFDPADRTSPFLVLPNTTGTDIFCSAQTLLPSGQVLIAGGDRAPAGVRNFANSDVNLFDRRTNTLTRQAASMRYRRWYATLVTLPNGDALVLGGEDDRNYSGPLLPTTVESYSITPELFNVTTGWRTLPGASSAEAFRQSSNYSYPKAWVAPDGKVVVLGNQGAMFRLDPTGQGALQALSPRTPLAVANSAQAAVMHRPGKILSARAATRIQEVDINPARPVVRDLPPAAVHRRYGTMTVLADGMVLSNGGSAHKNADVTYNALDYANYGTELWDPVAEKWLTGPTAAKPRLYHSNALLLKDGTVLTGGGGAPGPVLNLNAEVYYPPYLWRKDGSGRLADRPVILSVSTAVPTWGQKVGVVQADFSAVQRVTLVRSGAATHAFNADQRFMELDFTQTGRDLLVTMPARAQVAPPGYYLLFVFNAQGVPSVAQTLRLG